MTAITRYIVRQIAGIAFFAVVILCLLVILAQSLRLLALIVGNGLPLSRFLLLTLLVAPRYLVYLLPLALFGAVLFVGHRMMRDNELTVLAATGCSGGTVMRPVVLVALVSTLCAYALTLYLAPLSQQALQKNLSDARAFWSGALIHAGEFTPLDDRNILYIGARDADGTLHNILYYEGKTGVTLLAETGVLKIGPTGQWIVALNGSKHYLDNGQARLLYFDRATIQSGGNPQGGTRWRQPRERFLPELLNPGPEDGPYLDRLRAEVHNCLLSPLLCLTLSLIALTAVLYTPQGRRPRRTPIWMTAATLVTLWAYLIHMLLLNTHATSFIFTILLYGNVALPIIGAAILIHRKDRILA